MSIESLPGTHVPARPARAVRDKQPAKPETVIHEVDGIRELDNDLPRWWLFALYGTMVFALGYWFHYQVIGSGLLPRAVFHQEMQSEYAAQAARIRAAGTVSAASLQALARDDHTVREGDQIFHSTCAPCHGANGGGVIGPNLTDDSWIHGGRPDQIYQTVTNGVSARGMPAWGPQLGADRVQAVTAYLLTLRNTNVRGGKAPQGTREP